MRSRIEEIILKSGVEVLWSMTSQIPCLDVPYITVVWDLQHRRQPFFPEVSLQDQWRGREQASLTTLRRAAVVITGTKIGRWELEHFYGVSPDRIEILPHPTPRFALEADGVEAHVSPLRRPNAPYLLYPAQFWAHKNHVALIEALHLLRRDYDLPLDLVLVGADKGNLSHVRRWVQKRHLDDAVHFHGFVAQPELVALYKGAFALCYVSFFGPENLPPLEAFALGCPVIASSVAGAEEQLGDAALLVDPTDAAGIAATIARLWGDPSLRNRLVALGRQRAASFTPHQFVKGVFEILDTFEPVRRTWGSGNVR